MSRHQDDFNARIEFHDSLERFHSAHLRHDKVEQNDLWVFVEDDIQTVFRIGGGKDLKAILRQGFGDQLQAFGSVVNGHQFDV